MTVHVHRRTNMPVIHTCTHFIRVDLCMCARARNHIYLSIYLSIYMYAYVHEITWGLNMDRSSVVYLPSTTSSAIARPAAGACCSPWPENPLQMRRLSTGGILPINAF